VRRVIWISVGLITLALQRPASIVGRPNFEIRGGAVVLRTETTAARLLISGDLQPLPATGDPAFVDLSPDQSYPSVVVNESALPDARLDILRAHPAPPVVLGSASGSAVRVSGRGAGPIAGLRKTLHVEIQDETPGIAYFQAAYRNTGPRPLHLKRIEVLRWRLDTARNHANGKEPLWSFHGSAELSREKNLAPLRPGFSRQNQMGGMTEKGRGGGIPIVAFWNSDGGLALGLAEETPRVLSIPVRVHKNGQVEASLTLEPMESLDAGESYKTPLLFVASFHGDFHDAIVTWRRSLELRGMRLPPHPEGAYEPSWCSWGFGRRVTPEWMLNALPKVKELGFRWVTLDDGWFDRYGDYNPRGTFGDAGIRRVVDACHEQKLRVQLWWHPLAVEDGLVRWEKRGRKVARVAKEHPEWLVLNESGDRTRTFSPLALMCPAVPDVKRYHRRLVRRFLGQWGFDGLKIDKVYSVPPCYNPAHGHKYPEESIEKMGDVFRAIIEEARSVRPDSVIQICPCETLPNLAWLPYMNQAVTADPMDSADVRWRTKMYKALFGPRAPVFADHVELTRTFKKGYRLFTTGTDFASAVGVGAVPGSRFVWPPIDGFEDVNLTPDKEKHFKRWIALYESKRLGEGEFRNLYFHGVDRPEAYAISKDGRMYYAFYADDSTASYSGPIELRGLASAQYRVVDYENGREIGVVKGPIARIEARFRSHLLLEATPFQSRR
jgi:alpha-galactosidase